MRVLTCPHLPRIRRRSLFLCHRRFASKLCTTEAVLATVNLDGATVAVGGFGPCGVPQTWIDALVETESAQNLTLIALDVGTDDRGVGKLLRAGK